MFPIIHYSPSVAMIWTSMGIVYVLIMYPAEKNDLLNEGYIALFAMIIFLTRSVLPQIVFYFLYIVELQNLINWVRNLKCKVQSPELFENSFTLNFPHFNFQSWLAILTTLSVGWQRNSIL